MAKSAGRGSGFGAVSVTYDFWPKAQAAGQASEQFRSRMIFGQKRRPRVRLRSSFGHVRFLAKSAGRGSGFGAVSVTYDFWPKAQAAGQASEQFRSRMIFGQKRRPRVRLRSSFGHVRFLAKSAGRGSGFGAVSVMYDFWPKAQAAGQASEQFRSRMIFGQKRRPRVRLRSSFGHVRFLAKSAGRGSGFEAVSVTYDFWPKAQAAGQASEQFRSRIIFGQKRRPRVRLRSSFGHV